MDDLRYVEMLLAARHSGNLASESWESSVITAFAWSGKLNPLGASLVDWLDGFKEYPSFLARFLLAGECSRLKLCKDKDAVDCARDAMGWYHTRNCKYCEGRGVLDQTQTQCPACSGTGIKAEPYEAARKAVKSIEGALEWINAQMAYRMRYSPHQPKEQKLVLTINMDGGSGEYIPQMGEVTKPHLSDQWGIDSQW